MDALIVVVVALLSVALFGFGSCATSNPPIAGFIRTLGKSRSLR